MPVVPQWAILSLAEESHGTETNLARMLLDAQAEIGRLKDNSELNAKVIRYWMGEAMEQKKGQKATKERLVKLAGEMRKSCSSS